MKANKPETVEELLEKLFESGKRHGMEEIEGDNYYTTREDIEPEEAKQSLRQLLLAGVPEEKKPSVGLLQTEQIKQYYLDKGFNAALKLWIDYINKITE